MNGAIHLVPTYSFMTWMVTFTCIYIILSLCKLYRKHYFILRLIFSLFFSFYILLFFLLVLLHLFHLFISSLSFHFLSDPRMVSSALVTALLWRKTTKCCMSDTKFTLGRFPWSNNAAASLRRRVTDNHRLDIPETWAQECHKSASSTSFLAAVTNAECKQYIALLTLTLRRLMSYIYIYIYIYIWSTHS